MIYFTSDEILISIICALIFGGAIAIIFVLLDSIWRVLHFCIENARLIYMPKMPLSQIFKRNFAREYDCSAAEVTVRVVSCAVGFILLSYAVLDGEIRLYMLFLASASFYLSKNTLCRLVKILLDRSLRLVCCFVILILRTVFYPFCSFYRICFSKIVKSKH